MLGWRRRLRRLCTAFLTQVVTITEGSHRVEVPRTRAGTLSTHGLSQHGYSCLLACLLARRVGPAEVLPNPAQALRRVSKFGLWCETFWEELLSWTSFSPLSVSLSLSLSLSLSFFRQGNGVEDCSPTPRASAPPTVAGGHGGKRLCWQGPQPSRAKYLEKRDEGGDPCQLETCKRPERRQQPYG